MSLGLRPSRLLGASVFIAVLTGAALAAAPPIVPVGVSAEWVARAKANGLGAGDADLASELTALADKRRGMTVRPPAPDLKLSDRFEHLTFGDPSKATALRGVGVVSLPGVTTTASPAAAPIPEPSIGKIENGKDDAANDDFFELLITGKNLKASGASTVVDIDTSCGILEYGATAFDQGSFTDTNITLHGFFPVPKDEKDHLIVSVGAKVSAPKDASIKKLFQCYGTGCSGPTVVVNDDSTTACGKFVPCTPGGTVFLSKSPRLSTNPTDGKVEGDDIIGYGIQTVNHFAFKPKIVSVSSLDDAPGSNQSSDQWRGAKITQKPSDGRMETHVHWYHKGGESISYTVEYEYDFDAIGKASAYFRQTTGYPKQTPCPTEE